jgi:hypothetical protein
MHFVGVSLLAICREPAANALNGVCQAKPNGRFTTAAQPIASKLTPTGLIFGEKLYVPYPF